MGKTTWTEDEIEFVKVRYNKPQWTASKIAGELGKTKNAVIGCAGRLGLTQKPARVSQAPVFLTEHVPDITLPIKGVMLKDAENHHCRYMNVVGWICGQQIDKKSYCTEHLKVVFDKGNVWSANNLHKLIEMHRDKATVEEIIDEIGLTRKQVENKIALLRRKGVLKSQ